MTPTFVLILDKELVWGSLDHTSPEAWSRANPDPRGVVHELLRLLDEYGVPATWAVVGHLFLASCRRAPDGKVPPEIVRPNYDWHHGDWLRADPCTDALDDPLFYGADIVDMISGASAGHEI